MIRTRPSRALALLAALTAAVPAPLPAQTPHPTDPPAVLQPAPTEYDGAAALGLALRRLGTTKRVLMIGAHPDDENTAILSTLALGQGADVAYLSLTRGEGGQNGIGPELGEALGLLRSEELLAARRLDGARQFFTRAYDYGFSKSADEAFRHWPQDTLLGDVVRVIRTFRPDVVVSIFSGTPADGHGQHQAAGILAREAFAVAGDAARYPEQLAGGLRPWAPEKLYQALWRGGEGGVQLETGTYDPLFGRSYYQIAMASRSRHRSQDMGQLLGAGPRAATLRLIASRAESGSAPAAPGGGETAAGGLFAGIDTTLAGFARGTSSAPARGRSGSDAAALLAAYGESVAKLRAGAGLLDPAALVAPLAAALGLLDRASAALPSASSAADAELRFRLAAERADAQAALAHAAGITLDAIASREAVAPGDTFSLELSLWNGGRRPVAVRELAPVLPAGWTAEPVEPLAATAAPGTLATRRFRVRVAPDAPVTEPYFLRRPLSGDLYTVADPALIGLPFESAAVRARAELEIVGARVGLDREATFRGLDKMQGELRRPVRVVPAVTLAVDPALAVVATNAAGERRDTAALRLGVRVSAPGASAVEGSLRPSLPAGWRAEPAATPLRLAAGEQRVLEFRVQPPARVAAGDYQVGAAFEFAGGARYDRGFALVDYPHVAPRALYRPATAKAAAFDITVPAGLRIGYIGGAGDDVPDALERLGLAAEPLDAASLASADLSRYDVIVTGIRAYEVRPDLVQHNARLLDYVRRGGTLIVQYNKYEYTAPGIAPYPLSIARPHDRVTDEAAAVRVLDPAHAVFNRPNRITAADFEGWIQERGLYFPREWDARYTPLLEMADPGEAPLQGALLVAKYGEGTYVYTGLSFFRQLPAGVPGAYRLFANLLALGAGR